MTAVAGQATVGFIDARYFSESSRGIVEAPHLRRTWAYDAPHSEIRNTSGDDGFYVIESERNKKIGQALFDLLKESLKCLGARDLSVEQPKDASFSFYKRNGGKPHISGFSFDL